MDLGLILNRLYSRSRASLCPTSGTSPALARARRGELRKQPIQQPSYKERERRLLAETTRRRKLYGRARKEGLSPIDLAIEEARMMGRLRRK